LLLYAIFHMGNATQNVSWETYQDIKSNSRVAWTIPISLGDSHRGYRVVGTNNDFFEHYRYGSKRALQVDGVAGFSSLNDTVVGYQVAQTLGYKLGDKIVIAHGLGEVSFAKHDKHPFVVTGILKPTGTPVDRAVLVGLDALEAIHAGWKMAAYQPKKAGSGEALTPDSITAFLVGLKSRVAIFQVQRAVNEYRQEPLLAVVPGVTLMELWNTLSVVESTLLALSALVTIISLIGMVALMLATLNERRREMALLRALGARAGDVLLLIVGEALATTLCAVVLALGLFQLVTLVGGDWLETTYSLRLGSRLPSTMEWQLMGGVIVAGMLCSLLPAIRAYRQSLVDGMTPR
jgi:putative ABC transport system permease protein